MAWDGLEAAMILSIEGDESTGKSTLAYTAPLPIVGLSTDMGHERAIYGSQFAKWFKGLDIEFVRYSKGGGKVDLPVTLSRGKDILIYELPAPIQFDPIKQVGYLEQWDYLLEVFMDQVQEPEGSLVTDTMTLLNRNRRNAHLQFMQKKDPSRSSLIQIEYGKPNEAIRDLYQAAQAFRKNMVVTHHLKQTYEPEIVNGKVEHIWKGKYETDGVPDTRKQVDVSLRMSKEGSELKGMFMKCGYNLSLEGDSLPNPSWNMLVAMIENAGWEGRPFVKREKREEAGA